jgi:AraC-like DNA-binding protein
MIDPLTEVIALLQPRAVFSKASAAPAAGRALLGLRRAELLRGARRQLSAGGRRAGAAHAGGGRLRADAGHAGFHDVGFRARDAGAHRPQGTAPAPTGEVRHGTRGGRPDVRLLGGYFVFDSPDAALLVSLLPALVHVRGVERLSVLVRLVGEESRAARSGRELVLTRLVEVLLIEALRSSSGDDAPPGLLRGLADQRLAAGDAADAQRPRALMDHGAARAEGGAVALVVLRALHAGGRPAADGIPAGVAHGPCQEAAAPARPGIGEVAQRVGYSSASTFSTAFSRHVGQPPGRYARALLACAPAPRARPG